MGIETIGLTKTLNKMTTLRIAREILENKVSVVYPDGKNGHELTVSKVIDRFKEEESWWLDRFLNNLINTGEATTAFGAKYKLIAVARELSEKEEKEFQADQDNLNL